MILQKFIDRGMRSKLLSVANLEKEFGMELTDLDIIKKENS